MQRLSSWNFQRTLPLRLPRMPVALIALIKAAAGDPFWRNLAGLEQLGLDLPSITPGLHDVLMWDIEVAQDSNSLPAHYETARRVLGCRAPGTEYVIDGIRRR